MAKAPGQVHESEAPEFPHSGLLWEEMAHRVAIPGHEAPNVIGEEGKAVAFTLAHLQDIVRGMRDRYNHAHPVDEYISTQGVPFSGVIDIQPTWSIPERIESIIAFIPNEETTAGMLGSGQVTNPAANAPVTGASVVLPQGVYDINWSVGLAGTLTPTDRNNFLLLAGATPVATAENNINVGVVYGQAPLRVVVPAGGLTYSITVGANANAAAVYLATLSATPLATDVGQQIATLQLGDRFFQLPIGLTTIQGVGIILNQDDTRRLTISPAPVTGPVHIELMGWADEIFGNA
jgi:hypothetical protein